MPFTAIAGHPVLLVVMQDVCGLLTCMTISGEVESMQSTVIHSVANASCLLPTSIFLDFLSKSRLQVRHLMQQSHPRVRLPNHLS